MKKIFKTAMFAVAVMAAGYGGVKAYNIANLSQKDLLIYENVEALSSDGDCPTGGMANSRCPIWNVSTTTTGSLTGPQTSVTCTTGGSWKCVAGKCPHGR